MTSDWTFQVKTRALPSPSDLKQIKEAVRELRASSPRSVLADLVDEKIRAMESSHPVPSFHLAANRTRWVSY